MSDQLHLIASLAQKAGSRKIFRLPSFINRMTSAAQKSLGPQGPRDLFCDPGQGRVYCRREENATLLFSAYSWMGLPLAPYRRTVRDATPSRKKMPVEPSWM